MPSGKRDFQPHHVVHKKTQGEILVNVNFPENVARKFDLMCNDGIASD